MLPQKRVALSVFTHTFVMLKLISKLLPFTGVVESGQSLVHRWGNVFILSSLCINVLMFIFTLFFGIYMCVCLDVDGGIMVPLPIMKPIRLMKVGIF